MAAQGSLHVAASRRAAVPLLRDYVSRPGHFDEMASAPGAQRPHWQYLLRSLEALGADDLAQRHAQVRELLYENGVTYNVYDDPQHSERPWPLDPVPVLFTSRDWSAVEQGLMQRAEMFDLLLADLYGRRHLLRSGKLPASLIFTHPGFLLPCAGDSRLGWRGLQIYAADLGRTLDGEFRVIGDRTQAPSGMGYALENRTLLSRIFPSLYRDSHVHRLALFFRGLRASLLRLVPARDEAPRIVLLTPGPENETYFEHVFLANYLGYTLVQGGDLVVDDDCVWLKALGGNQRVDVILRRVDDAYCDPLELRPESVLGIPGLLQAARLGNVAIANPLGSSVLENPGLMPFLNDLCRELLDEDLKLSSVQTWWCGAKQDRLYVLEHLDRLVVKPIFPHASAATAFGPALSLMERRALAERIHAQPHLFVGQELLPLSTAPALGSGGLEPRPMVVRGFVAADEHGYRAMPGGLCRVASSSDSWLVSNQSGGVSKDVWVLASEPELQVTLLPHAGETIRVKRDGDEVPGRVADDLFWLGRYSERTEGAVRLLREVVQRLMGAEPGAPDAPDDALRILLRATTVVTGTFPGFVPIDPETPLPDAEAELLRLVFDRSRPGALRYDIEAMVRAGRSVRDRLSSDATRVIITLNREGRRTGDLTAATESLQRVLILLAAFAGLCEESMTRGQGWRFLEIGRRLERAIHAVTLLRAVAVPALVAGATPWEALLAIAHSVKTYRRRYRAVVQPAAVLDLLLVDESNPRSVGHQLARLEELVAGLDSDESSRRGAPYRLALEVRTLMRLVDIEVLMDSQPAQQLDELLDKVCRLLKSLSDEITRRYFAGLDVPQQLVRVV